MAQSIHINTMREMLKAGDPVDITLWTKSGQIQRWRNCISLRYDFYKGVRRVDAARQPPNSHGTRCVYL